jgi:hypothetical protein
MKVDELGSTACAGRGRSLEVRLGLLSLLLAPLAPAFAQRVSATSACNGEIVTAIETNSHPPGSTFVENAWLKVGNFTGMHHVTTRPEVIKAYLVVEVGKACSEIDRSESERLLRAQRYIASATVSAVPDGPGRIKIVVDVVDDLAPIVGGSTGNGTVTSLLLGTENLAGRGITVELSAERGFKYRSGFGGDIIQYGAFGKPFTLAIGGEVHPQGDALRFEFSKPFLTDLQPNGFHVGATELNNYYDLTRPVGDDIFLNVQRVSYDVGVGTRVARLTNSGLVGVIGGLVMGEDVHTASTPVFMTDSGLFAAPGFPEVTNRYQPFSVVRAGVMAGIRALKFQTVRGFDAVTGAQDVGKGLQFGVFAGPSIWSAQHTSDFFFSGELYAGLGNPKSFLEMRITGEGRMDRLAQRWDGVVGYGKFKWYIKPSDAVTHIAALEISGVQHLAFPLQLSFWDHEGGLLGFPNALTVGGQRAIMRFEERRVVQMITKRADWAIALFANAGKIWAGDVPFGRNSDVRGAVGVSLLSAFPAGGKRLYRVDFAVPVNPDGAKFEVRFSSSDETRSIWRQPNDMAIAHSAAVLQNMGSWTPR